MSEVWAEVMEREQIVGWLDDKTPVLMTRMEMPLPVAE